MADRAFEISIEGTPVDYELYDDLLEVVVEDNGALADIFNIRLAISPLQSGEWKYVYDDTFFLFNRVLIKAWFDNGVSEVLIEGYITTVSTHFDAEEGKSYLEIQGMDPTVLMNLQEKAKAWPDKKDSEIAKTILNEYGFDPVVEDTTTIHNEKDFTVMQKGTDMQFLRNLAQRNGFECYVETDSKGMATGYFRRPVLNETPQKELSIRFGKESSLVYLKSHVDSLKPLAVGAVQIDIKAKETKSEIAKIPGLEKLGKNALPELIRTRLLSLLPASDVPISNIRLTNQQPVSILKSSSQAVLDEGSWFVSVQGEIDSVAYQSILKAKRTVIVKGAGKVFSGKYYVTKVSHIFTKEKKYVQRFEARRNALEPDGREKFGDYQWSSLSGQVA